MSETGERTQDVEGLVKDARQLMDYLADEGGKPAEVVAALDAQEAEIIRLRTDLRITRQEVAIREGETEAADECAQRAEAELKQRDAALREIRESVDYTISNAKRARTEYGRGALDTAVGVRQIIIDRALATGGDDE